MVAGAAGHYVLGFGRDSGLSTRAICAASAVELLDREQGGSMVAGAAGHYVLGFGRDFGWSTRAICAALVVELSDRELGGSMVAGAAGHYVLGFGRDFGRSTRVLEGWSGGGPACRRAYGGSGGRGPSILAEILGTLRRQPSDCLHDSSPPPNPTGRVCSPGRKSCLARPGMGGL